jgi:hypothetical protein
MNKKTKKELEELRTQWLKDEISEKEVKTKIHEILLRDDVTVIEHWLFVIGDC